MCADYVLTFIYYADYQLVYYAPFSFVTKTTTLFSSGHDFGEEKFWQSPKVIGTRDTHFVLTLQRGTAKCLPRPSICLIKSALQKYEWRGCRIYPTRIVSKRVCKRFVSTTIGVIVPLIGNFKCHTKINLVVQNYYEEPQRVKYSQSLLTEYRGKVHGIQTPMFSYMNLN